MRLIETTNAIKTIRLRENGAIIATAILGPIGAHIQKIESEPRAASEAWFAF